MAPAQARQLNARLEAARQIYNACLGEALKRARLLRERRAYRKACRLPRGGARTTAFMAVDAWLLGKRGRPRFKGYRQMDTVEGKSNHAGIRWRDGAVEWKGLVLPAIIDPRDPVVAHAFGCRVKYVRLVRRKLAGRDR
ncbi:MAG TPA: hypothetical protein VIL95_00590 [Bacillota bacterium]